MRTIFASLLLLAVAAAVLAEAEPQYGYGNPYAPNYFRAGLPHSSIDAPQPLSDGRIFWTLTLTLSTSTYTSTVVSTTTCTTSTAGLSVCTPSGRRRRQANKVARGLFYEDAEEDKEAGSIFLPSPIVEAPVAPVAVEEPVRVERETPLVPFIVQPGYSSPIGNARFMFAISTTTTTTTTTSYFTTSLTAICQSTTAYQLCGSSGK